MGLGQGLNCTVAGENRPGRFMQALATAGNSLIQHFWSGYIAIGRQSCGLLAIWSKEVFPLISADATYFVQEGKCISRRVAMKRSNIILCPGDNVQLILPCWFYFICGKMEAPLLPLRLPNLALTMPLATDNSGCEHFSELAKYFYIFCRAHYWFTWGYGVYMRCQLCHFNRH